MCVHVYLHRDSIGNIGSTALDPFFSARMGYRMCMYVYLNGDGIGKNNHLSLFSVLMRGE
jgi:hypothetical protein